MKKKWKKILAGVCAASMVLTSANISPAVVETHAAVITSGDEWITTGNGLKVKLTVQCYGESDDNGVMVGLDQTSGNYDPETFESTADINHIFDGNDSTGVIFRRAVDGFNDWIQEGDYIQVEFENPIAFEGVSFKFDTNNSNDTFWDSTLMYKTTDADEWQNLGTISKSTIMSYTHSEEAIPNVSAIKLVTAGSSQTAWVKLMEIAVSAAGVVDKTALNVAIANADALTESNYTTDSWAELEKALAEAKSAAASEEATQENVDAVTTALNEAITDLAPRKYTTDDPFVFPSEVGASATLEAEFAYELVNVNGNASWPLQISPADWTGNGYYLNCLDDNGDIAYYAFNASRAGTYSVVLKYNSGSSVNSVNWSTLNADNSEGLITSGNSGVVTQGTGTATFEMTVERAGAGVLVLTPGSGKAPQMDSFTITLLECTHATTELQGAKDATCTEAGYTGDEVCTTCGDTVKYGEAIPAAHKPGDAATCTTAQTCTVCGEKITDALGHKTELQGAKDATCTEAGYTGDEVCTACGVTVTTGTAIDATGHNYADGVCQNCGDEVKLTLALTARPEGSGTVVQTLPDGKTDKTLVLDDKVTVTATAADGYKFVYWVNTDTNSVVSYDAEYTFTMLTHTNLAAVFVEEEQYTVVFKTTAKFANKEVLNVVVAENETVIAPTPTVDFIGYAFEGWDSNGDGVVDYAAGAEIVVVADATYEAVYKAENLYTVTVVGGKLAIKEGEATVDADKYLMDTVLTATAEETKDGQVFAGWYNGDDTLVSTKAAYTFYVKGDLELTAVYVDPEDAVESTVPAIALNTYTRVQNADGTDKVRLQITWEAAEGCTIVGEGILRTYKSEAATEEAMVVGTLVSGITTNAAKGAGQNGSYAYNLTIGANSVNQNNSVFARGYVRYTVEGSDEIKVVYTDIIELTPVE